MATIIHTHKIYGSIETAKIEADKLNEFDDSGWTYTVKVNQNESGPKTAIIEVRDETGEFVSLL